MNGGGGAVICVAICFAATAVSAQDPPTPIDIKAVQAALRSDEIVVAFFLAEPQSYRWVMSQEHIVADRIAGRGAIEKASTRLLDLRRATASGADAKQAAAELGGMLFEHISTADDRPMIVVPHGVLNSVPFEVLPLQGKMLMERHAVSYAPSLNALVQSRRLPPRAAPMAPRFLAIALTLIAALIVIAKLRKPA